MTAFTILANVVEETAHRFTVRVVAVPSTGDVNEDKLDTLRGTAGSEATSENLKEELVDLMTRRLLERGDSVREVVADWPTI